MDPDRTFDELQGYGSPSPSPSSFITSETVFSESQRTPDLPCAPNQPARCQSQPKVFEKAVTSRRVSAEIQTSIALNSAPVAARQPNRQYGKRKLEEERDQDSTFNPSIEHELPRRRNQTSARSSTRDSRKLSMFSLSSDEDNASNGSQFSMLQMLHVSHIFFQTLIRIPGKLIYSAYHPAAAHAPV